MEIPVQKELVKKFEQIVAEARVRYGVSLDGFRATFTNRGKRRIVSYKKENGKTVAVFNAKWLTDENRKGLLENLVYHAVANRVLSERGMSSVPQAASATAVFLGATDARHLAGLKTPDTCKRVAKTKSWAYIDTSGRQRLVSTRIHNRIQRERISYRYRDNGATITASGFVGHV